MAPVPAGDGCLHGKVFGLTGELPRKPLEAAIKSQGATVSAIIHKRVSFVLCTADAVKYSTQKVRKALKHGIPLVSQDFIAACALASHVVDHSPFLQSPKPESQASPSNGAKQPKPKALETPGDAAASGSGGDSAPDPAGNNVAAEGKFCVEGAPGENSKKKRRRQRFEESEPTRRPGGGEGGAGEGDNGGGGGGGDAGEPKERKKKKEQKEKNQKKEQKEKKKKKKEKRERKEIEAQKVKEENTGNEENVEKKEKKDKKKKRRKVAASENDSE